MLTMYVVIISTFVAIVVVCMTQPIDDVLRSEITPFSNGLSHIFSTNSKSLLFCIVPSMIAALSCFLFASSRLLFAMSRSGLYPVFLGRRFTANGVLNNSPVIAILTGSVLSFFLALLAWIFRYHLDDLINAANLAYMVAYVATCLSFVIMRRYFEKSEEVKYLSYTGFPGAIYGSLVFILIFLSLCVNSRAESKLMFAAMIGLSCIYYFAVARDRQRLSPEEKSILMVAHIIKGFLLIPMFLVIL